MTAESGPEPATHRAIVVCEQWAGSTGYAGLTALRRAGWTARAFNEWEFVPVRWRTTALKGFARLLRSLAVRELGRELVREASQLHPEFVLVFKGTFIPGSALVELRALGVKTYCFYPDVSFRAHGSQIPSALPLYDWVFTTKKFGLRDMREQLGVTRTSLLRHACDTEVHRPLQLSGDDRARYGCDASFIGTWSPKKENLLRELVERRPDMQLRVWGERWNRAAAGVLKRAIMGHHVQGDEFARAIAGSKINIAILSERREGASDGDQITTRTFHIPASGGFMLHERTPELLEILRESVDVACFSGADELSRQVGHYLNDPRERETVAKRGRATVLAHHTWDHRIQDILLRHGSL